MPPALPLDLRLPNPPPLFIGREDELAWLDDAARRAPLTLLWGPEGAGKTALLCQWLHRRSGLDTAAILYLTLPPVRTPEALAEALLVQLARAEGLTEHLDFTDLAREPLAALGVVLDQVDQAARWMVWDDTHLLDPAALRAMLNLLARYARDSRWLVLGRQPCWTLPAQTLLLQPLHLTHRAQLLAAWTAPNLHLPEAAQRALLQTHTSLRDLEHAVWGAVSDAAAPTPLPALTEPQRRALELLRATTRPLPARWLTEIAGCDEDAQDALRAARLVRDTPTGLRPDERRAEALTLGAPSDATLRRIVRTLGQAQPIPLLMEALRLAATHALDDELDALLQRRFDALRRHGALVELWSYLRDLDRPALTGWRLRCACELGDVLLLANTPTPPLDTWERLAWWSRALQLLGRYDELVLLAQRVPERLPPPRPEDRRHVAAHRHAYSGAHRTQGRPDDAHLLLSRDEAPDPELTWQAHVLELRILIHQGRRDDALRKLAALEDEDAATRRQLSLHEAYTRIYLYYILQEFSDALRLLDAHLDNPSRPVVLFEPHLLLCGGLLLETGDTARAGRFAQQALLHSQERSFNHASALGIALEAHLHAGELDEARARYLALTQALPSLPAEFAAHAYDIALRLNLLTGAALPLPDLPPQGSFSDEARVQIAMTQHLAALRCDPDPPPLPPCDDDALPTRARHALLRAYQALRAHQPADLDDLLRWAEVLAAQRWLRGALDVAHAACELALIQRPDLLDAAARTFKRLADQSTALGVRQEASFFCWCAHAPRDAAQAHAFLHDHPRALLAQRRLRALLHEPAHLDRVDLLLLDALRRRHAFPPPSPAHPAWGYDAALREAWTDAGQRCSLASRQLAHRLLCALAAAGGALSKEDLLLQVWDEPHYHPLKHDNRLRVLVKKLRQHLDAHLGGDGWIETLEDGYALRPPFSSAHLPPQDI